MTPRPPAAKLLPTTRTHHDDTVTDEYAWLADPDDPDTLAYLTAENAYTEAITGHLAALQAQIFAEIQDRTQEDDLSVPVRIGRYWYYTRTLADRQYPRFCRQPAPVGESAPPAAGSGPFADEEVVLDADILAAGHDFLAIGTFELSPDGRFLAYSVDHQGRERFTLRVREIASGQDMPAAIPDTYYGAAWARDGSALYYVVGDPSGRPHQVWRHHLAAPAADDALIYQETDPQFGVTVALGRSGQFIQIESRSATTSEVWLVPADEPAPAARLVAPRRPGVDYRVQHDATGGRLLILHNAESADFALAWTPDDAPAEWRPLIPAAPGVRLTAVDAFATHLVVSLRVGGMTGVRVLPLAAGGRPYDIDFPAPVHRVTLENNPEYHTKSIRLRYASLATPDSIYDYQLASGDLVLRKRSPVHGIDPDAYRESLHWAKAPDGTAVPISLVHHRDALADGPAPCVLYGYGAYGISTDPWFAVSRLSLLDRGVVFAIAHVRGGGELGGGWHDDGKLLAKQHTFTDFLACARHLVGHGIAAAGEFVARGGSAGGLLMGAVANLAPAEFSGIVAQVPFVDPLTSLLDPSLALNAAEWEEWGNVLESPEAYRYVKGYAPYDNVAPRAYPPILALPSLHDARVGYAEAAKWIARLRRVAPAGTYLLRTDLHAGHHGASGRHRTWREESFVLAWILDRFPRARLTSPSRAPLYQPFAPQGRPRQPKGTVPEGPAVPSSERTSAASESRP